MNRQFSFVLLLFALYLSLVVLVVVVVVVVVVRLFCVVGGNISMTIRSHYYWSYYGYYFYGR